MTQNSGPTGSSTRAASQGRSCSQPQASIPIFATPATLAAAHEQRAAPGVEVALAEGERLLQAQAAAPEHHNQGAQPEAMAVVGGLAPISSTVGGSAG